jgi:enterochelin esterase family protein
LKELVFHPPFNQFIVSELMPWIYLQYAVTTNPAKTVIGGSSAGGLAAAYAALEHPQTFGNVLSQSGAFSLSPSWETDFSWLTHQYALREKESLKFHLDVGTLEKNSYRELRGRPNTLEANRHMRDTLTEKDYSVHYVEFRGGHDYVSWQGTLGEGLKALLG